MVPPRLGRGGSEIQAELGGEVKSDAQSRLPLGEKKAVALVGFLGRTEPGVLAHGPKAAAVHGRIDAAGEREFTGIAEVFFRVEPGRVAGPQNRLDLDAGRGFEPGFAGLVHRRYTASAPGTEKNEFLRPAIFLGTGEEQPTVLARRRSAN